jgi:AhpD family alkylhydroperoxidase
VSADAAARVPPGDRRALGLPLWAFAQIAGRVTGGPPPNIFLTLGRHRGLFRGWLHFAGRLMPGGKLPRRETELVILRVAHVTGCSYEWDHHVRLGRRAGISAEEVERVKQGPEAAGWGNREGAILTAVDELLRDGDVSDETWTALRRHLDERLLVELVMLTGHYEMLAKTIRTLRIQPDGRH